MIYLLFPLILLNSYLGFFLFRTYTRTKSKTRTHILFFDFWCLSTALILLSRPFTHFTFSACIPLLIGFFCFSKFKIDRMKDKSKNLDSFIIICEMTLIYLKTGRSFHEALRLSLDKTGGDFFKFCEDKKNVVMQQPKSSKSQIFVSFQQDLARVGSVKVGKQELLQTIKAKYDSINSLKQKLNTATTQYRAQSFTLIILWTASFSSLIWQNKLFLYKNTVVMSFFLMMSGLLLSKKILIKNEFRI